MNSFVKLPAFFCFFFTFSFSYSQTDSLFLKNKNLIVGEIKSMDKGVLIMETSYSKEDFKIEWLEIERIISKVPFLITTEDGERFYGVITGSDSGKMIFKPEEQDQVELQIVEVIDIAKVEKGFLDRLNAGIDMGFTMTRARNQRQFTLRSRIGYITQKWTLDASINTLYSKQDETEDIRRMDANLTYIYLLRNDWFAVARLDFLSNTEQKLDLRTNTKLGLGKFINRSNKLYWNASAGFSFNNEQFSGEAANRQSAESWFGSEVNLYDIGDFNLLSNVFIYPSLTEKGRIRMDYRIDLKYDLPLDFYIKTGLTWNYDNQPTSGANTHDYVWQTTFGWSW